MKRSLILAAILAVSVFLVISAFVSADDEVVSGNQTRPSFIDADGDGICDNSGKALGSGQGWGKKYRTNFVDEDGDGVCDNFVDEDGDGICDLARGGQQQGTPSPQKPEWSEQKESKSYQHKNENNASSDQNQRRFNHREENTWNRQSSRQSRENFGNGICNGTGPKGSGSQKGNGQK